MFPVGNLERDAPVLSHALTVPAHALGSLCPNLSRSHQKTTGVTAGPVSATRSALSSSSTADHRCNYDRVVAEYILLLHKGPTRGVVRAGYVDQRMLKVGDLIPEDTTQATLRLDGVSVWKVDAIGKDGVLHCVQPKPADHVSPADA